MIAPMECECILTGNSISNTLKVWQTALRRDILVSLCQRNMLSIDCDHDPVNGLFIVSKALDEYWPPNWHTDIPYECVGYLCNEIRHGSCIPTLRISRSTYFCQDANDGMRLVGVRFQPWPTVTYGFRQKWAACRQQRSLYFRIRRSSLDFSPCCLV